MLKLWRDGDKTNQYYWMKDHEWEVLHSVELLTTKDVSKDRMTQVEWALSDKDNPFTALSRNEGGLLYSKHRQRIHQPRLLGEESTLGLGLCEPRTARARNLLDGKDSSPHIL